MSGGRVPGKRGAGSALFVALASAAFLGGCSADSGERRSLTQRERDSTIAASPLPGAGTVGKALEISDSAAVQRDRGLPDAP